MAELSLRRKIVKSQRLHGGERQQKARALRTPISNPGRVAHLLTPFRLRDESVESRPEPNAFPDGVAYRQLGDGNELASEHDPVILSGSIPDVLEWVRSSMDHHPLTNSNSTCSLRRSASEIGNTVRNDFLSQVKERGCVYIKMNGRPELWTRNSRFWEHVSAYAIKLPAQGQAKSIFEAMRRYPSSHLVHHDLELMFGKNRCIQDEPFRAPNGCRTVSLFDHYGRRANCCGHWFEKETHGRLQDMAVHMIAITEYITRCAYRSRESAPDADRRSAVFFELVRSHIVREEQEAGSYLRFSSKSILEDMSAKSACECLKQTLCTAHCGIVEGATAVGRTYGCKASGVREKR